MTRLAFLRDATERLAAAGIESPRRNAEWIVEEVTGASRAHLFSRPAEPLAPEARARAEAMIERRIAGEPVQYVLGHADFMDLRLRVTPAVLIPRSETEEVAEAALDCLQGVERPLALDVGTGSGALALAIKHARPDAVVIAADVSPEALEVAAGNAESLGLDVDFVEADALRPQFVDRVPPLFDLVVSNPPYVPLAEKAGLQVEVRDHEPDLALFVDADPLVFYRALAGHAERLLRPGGWLVVETHADYGEAVRDLFSDSGLVETSISADLSGRARIARGRRA